MRIAVDYGRRLDSKTSNLRQDALKLLAETYSSHSFVIDQREASSLFHRVREATSAERGIVDALGTWSRFQRQASSEFLFCALSEKASTEEKTDATTQQRRNQEANGEDPSRPDGASDVAPKRSRRAGTQPFSKRMGAGKARSAERAAS